MMKLFYLHMPKCAGMSFLQMLRREMGSKNLYQSTSLIQNYWNNHSDITENINPSTLKALIGHWLHEEMLHYFSPQKILLATSLRDPTQRTRSQYKFDYNRAQNGHWEMESEDDFLKSNSNVLCKFLIRSFPSLSDNSATLSEQAINILSVFDYVYDSVDTNSYAERIFNDLGLEYKGSLRINTSDSSDVELKLSDETIAVANIEDIKLYEYFHKISSNESKNPFFIREKRIEFNRYIRDREPNNNLLQDYIAEKTINELINVYGKGKTRRFIDKKRMFADKLNKYINLKTDR